MSSPSLSCISPQSSSPSLSIVKELSASKFPVYLASNPQTNQQTAIKVFPIDDIRYHKEKKILTQLAHPYIIGLQDYNDCGTVFEGEKRSFLGLEYASNGDLLEVIANHGKLPEILARSLFHQMIDALSYMHSQGIAHMDLKVDNLLISENFDLKITDFDLSQSTSSFRLDSKGTPGCRAPEVKKGICEDLLAADIYSAGIVLFILLSGNPPYGEVSRGYELEFDGFYRAMRRQNNRFWEAHSKHRRDSEFYSKEFRQLFGRMMEEDPEKRATMAEIKESEWFNGPVLDEEGCRLEMRKYMKKYLEVESCV